MSVILKFFMIDFRFVFVGVLVVLDILRDFGIGVWIKWFNDVWVGNRKIFGVLMEVKGDFVIMGVGFNVNNEILDGLKEIVIFMMEVLGEFVDIGEVLERLFEYFGCWYKIFFENLFLVVEEVCGRMMLIGKEVRVLFDGNDFVGRVIIILDDGFFILDVDG